MNKPTVEKLQIGLIVLALLLLVALMVRPANATGGRDDDGQRQGQEQHQKQHQDQSQTSEAHAASESASAANNEGNSLSVNQDYEWPADLVLVPNNNTEGCLRVFGFSFGNRDGSGMFGVPFRSKRCDYEQAADDAFAAGERELGWFWKCHNKSLYKPFQSKGEAKESAITDCHARMVGEVTNARVIEGLKADIVFLQNERKIEREECTESKNRITESCYQK